jgi:enoyl-CoA hydratase
LYAPVLREYRNANPTQEREHPMLDPDSYSTIQIEKRANGVAIATLNRPEKLNAVDSVMHTELTTLSVNADADPDVKVLLITGAGRAFCAGGDFSSDAQPAVRGGNKTIREARQIVDNLLDCEKPVITAVNGYAMGLGATIALLGDVVFAARSAIFADTHVNMGIGAGDGGQVIWPLLMGVNRAKYYLMTGERIAAEEAESLGLVNFLVEDDQLMKAATELADRLAKGPIRAISASKVPINKYIKMVSNLVLPLSLKLEEISMGSEDAREAATAFREKREAKFTGR